MALEWVVLGYAAGAEAIMVLLLTLPGLDGLRRGLVAVTRNLLKPFLSVVPFCLFLLMDIYWKYETRPSCEDDSCTPSEHLRHQKSIMKSQRNALLIAAALIFYWLLYSVTNLVVKIEQLNQRIERLKNKDWRFCYGWWIWDKWICCLNFVFLLINCDYDDLNVTFELNSIGNCVVFGRRTIIGSVCKLL